MTLIISVSEPDGITRQYLCELITMNGENIKQIVEARVLEKVDQNDPFHFKKTGDLISARQQDCLFVENN